MTTNLELAEQNLRVTSDILERCANSPKNINSDFSYYLEQMSWEMYRMANELQGRRDYYGEV